MPHAAASAASSLSASSANFSGKHPTAAEADQAFAAVRAALAVYQAKPELPESLSELRSALQAAAGVVVRIPRRALEDPILANVYPLIREISLSGVHDHPLLPHELELAQQFGSQGWPGLVAAMLIVPAWQWPDAPALETVPDWLWYDYTTWLFVAPLGFCAIGQVETYATHTLVRLIELSRWAERNAGSTTVRTAIEAYISTASFLPLYLSDQELRPHAELRARILSRAAGKMTDDYDPFPTPRFDRKLRVGFIQRDFGDQADTHATLPTFENLDTDRFEVVLIAQHPSGDALQEYCRQHAKEFHYLPADLTGQLSAVRGLALDVVVFGTNVTAVCDEIAFLALHRLAPLQVITDSSCITSGFSTVDLYLSNALTELTDAPEHFSERLGLLPGAGHAFKLAVSPQDASMSWTRDALSIPEDAIVFVTAADFRKITPEVQHGWARLLSSVPGSRLLVLPFGLSGGSSPTIERFCAQLDRVLAEHEITGERLIISAAAFATRADLKELLRVGDIYLDSYPWSEMGWLVESLTCGIPVVAREGKTSRSRTSAAILRTLQMDEFIAADESHYHDLVVHLASNVVRRTQLRAYIDDRMARSPLILDSLAASDGLGALLETAYDDIVSNGLIHFYAERVPVEAPALTDLAPAESGLAFGRFSDAVSCAQGVLAHDPANPRARHLLGAAWLKLGRPERAMLYLLEAVQHLENNASAWCDLAHALRANRQMREAMQAIQVCLSIDQHYLDAILLMGEIVIQTSQREELSKIVQLAESVAPHDPRVRALSAKSKSSSFSELSPFAQSNAIAFAPISLPTLVDPIEILSATSLDTFFPADVLVSLDFAQRGLSVSTPTIPTAAPTVYANVSRPNPRTLLFFLSAKESYRQPLFSSEEIFCGPDTETRNVAGRVSSIKVPAGSFDVRDVLCSIPTSQHPEILIVKADATGRNFPRNLGHLKCPKVLLVGDTHHMQRPIQSLLRYAKEETFDFVIFDHTRHHAHFFAEAGIQNVHWLPAVDYGFVPCEERHKPSHSLTFVGQAGRHHPYRCWVLDQVKAARLPLEILRGTLAQTANLYADSQITLNVSLNGDLNLRVFESLAAGGFLLTDELSAHSGLPQLFEAGKHLDTWRSPGELIEKIRYYLAHPAEAQRIRKAGHAELIRAHHPEVKLREFYDLIFSGQVNPVYDLSRDPRCASAMAKTAVAPLQPTDPNVIAYETLQELHRVSQRVTVFCARPTDHERLADLPRLSFVPIVELGAAEHPTASTAPKAEAVIWWEDAQADELEKHLLTFNGLVIAPHAPSAIVDTLESCGYTPVENGSAVFRLTQPESGLQRAMKAGQVDYVRARLAPILQGSQNSNECLALAQLADTLAEPGLKRTAIDRSIALDRNNQAALICLAANSLDEEDAGGALIMLEEAARVAPLPPEVEVLRANLYDQQGQQPVFAPYYKMIGRIPVPPAERPRKIVVVTNLFPPQELGGYGRKMWEFANGLIARGHKVRVLAGSLPEIAKRPTSDEAEMEQIVSRRLQLLGTWIKGIPSRVQDPKEIEARLRNNCRLIKDALKTMQADFMLAGNLDFLGVDVVNVALQEGVPVLQALGNMTPGYAVEEQPTSARYWIGPCSQWTAAAVRKGGYLARTEVVYPGARIDRFFRYFLPDRSRLRICFAGLVMPYKGVHVLVDALGHLHRAGIDFTAEIAGDTTDPEFITKLRNFAQEVGMTNRIQFTGFLDRVELAHLFGRSNVLVFPSVFDEPFGISHVEALAAGLVVVSSGTGGAREIIRDGVDGLLYPSDNAPALAEKLHALATNPELFARLQGAAQRRANDFAVERSIRKIEQCMEELISIS